MGKYKVVVDTNIFVSAFLGSKNAKLIVRDSTFKLWKDK